MQNESPQTSCFQHDHSPSRVPFIVENLRILRPFFYLAEEAGPMSTPRKLLPTRTLLFSLLQMLWLASYQI
jgi:hypothetical protein